MLDNPTRSAPLMLTSIARNLLIAAREKVLAQAFIVKAQHGPKRSTAYIDFWVDLNQLIDRLDWLNEGQLTAILQAFGPVDDDEDEALWSLVEAKDSLKKLLVQQ